MIFKMYYPAILQVVHAVLRWKRIQLNPLHRYQSSRDLLIMTVNVLERMRIHHWSRMLQRCNNGMMRFRRVSHRPDMSMVINAIEDYSIEKLHQLFTNQEVIIMLVSDYDKYCEELSGSNDKIARTIANLIFTANEYSLYTNNTATGDSITIE